MRLLTLQGYDIRKLCQPISLEKGTYQDDARVVIAQRELYQRLGEDQVIWMSQCPPTLFSCHVGRFVHEVEADWRDIVTVVDGLIWNHIIRDDGRYIPPEDHSELRALARQDVSGDYEGALRRIEDEYLRSRLPTNLWDGLCKAALEFPSDQLLARFPFVHSTVTAVHEVTVEMACARPFRAPSVNRR